MPGGSDDSSLTRVQPFFQSLFGRDASGRSWLASLLTAAPCGGERLGELADAPGWLVTPLAVPAASGRLACFEYPAVPSRELLVWLIDHSDRLQWPGDTEEMSSEVVRLRRALLFDEPPGSQARARDRAREQVARTSPFSREWWRFEAAGLLDCVLITDRLVVTIVGKRTQGLAAATEWYPGRSELVRSLEAAKHIAQGRAWATLLLSETPVPGGTPEDLARALPDGAPHLDDGGRAELRDAYLGNLTWEAACEAVGIPFAALPDTPVAR
jgi:hypothetical protein